MTARSPGLSVFCIILWICLQLAPSIGAAAPEQKGTGREAEIRAAITAFVQQKTANLGCEVRIRRISFSGSTEIPGAVLEYEVVAPQQWEGWGGANLAVIARSGDHIVKNLSVRVEVEALAEMVVTTRQVDHGTVLGTSDLALRKQDISLVQGRFLSRIEEAAGKKVRSTLKANAPVRGDLLEKVPLIKVGQLVTMVAENERLRITVTGKAKSAGAEGDTIMVQNLSSLKEIPARVVDANVVMVGF